MEKIKNKIKDKVSEKLYIFVTEHILKKVEILIVVGILLSSLIISSIYSSNIELYEKSLGSTLLWPMLKERFVMLLLILVSGFVPYFYIPAISFVTYIFMLSGDIVVKMQIGTVITTLLLSIIPVLIDIFTVSVIAAIGIYMCNYSGKKYRYATRTSFSFLDIKLRFYEITKKEDKYNELLSKKEKQIEKMKKNDVKIDYKQIIKIAPIAIVINLLISIVELYI